MASRTVDDPATFDFDEVRDLEVRLIGGSMAVTRGCGRRDRVSLRSLSGEVRSEFAGAGSGNVGGMSGNVSVTSASGVITPLRRERVGSETR